MITNVNSELGNISILVNNGGMVNVGLIENFDDKIYDDTIAVNLSATFHTIKHTVPQMKKAGWGRIINTASVAGTIIIKSPRSVRNRQICSLLCYKTWCCGFNQSSGSRTSANIDHL